MRKMEKLNRGLIAARAEKGIYLSWRFLGNEPDGTAWRIYRKRDGGDWELLKEILPRDVAPESRYADNPGIVKKNTAPYKYPRIVVFRDELPKTISGKIMRNQL